MTVAVVYFGFGNPAQCNLRLRRKPAMTWVLILDFPLAALAPNLSRKMQLYWPHRLLFLPAMPQLRRKHGIDACVAPAKLIFTTN